MTDLNKDTFCLGGHEFQSRFILGSGKYSLELIKAAVENAGAQMITLALRRANQGGLANILDYIPEGVTLLPNTSGARNAEEAVRIARLAREICQSDFIKIEVIHDSKYLLPDNYETVKATEILAKEGFVVMPYMYPDLNAARDLANAGAACVMPLGSPIGSNKGMRSICPSLWTRVSESLLRHARPWRWGLLQSWQIRPLPLPGIFLPWQKRFGKPSRRDEPHICPEWAVSSKKVPARPRR